MKKQMLYMKDSKNDLNQTHVALEAYYEKYPVLIRECLLALRGIILSVDATIVPVRKYQIPFFKYQGFDVGFLWVKKKKIVVGFIADPKRFPERATDSQREKVTMLEIHPDEDIPMEAIKEGIRRGMGK
jgi:hypothetical protein